MRLTRQCFQVSTEIARSFTVEEVSATFTDMKEMGIAHLPYPDLDIIAPATSVFALDKPMPEGRERDYTDMTIKIRYTGGIGEDWFAKLPGGRWVRIDSIFDRKVENGEEKRKAVLELWYVLLVVILATRNIIKEVRPHKAAQLGIGKGEYAATTTLRIGTITESAYEGERGHHASPRPHLRRGHIRRQHHGPQNELVKKVWIAPTMVNVDQEFIDRRTAYNVSL